jgi:hypothetical protein
MPTRRGWSELSQGKRRIIMLAGATEASLKIAALIDIKRRPADQIRGAKQTWAAAVILINSFGVMPLVYFRFGRRP